jgi:hypothetical protein
VVKEKDVLLDHNYDGIMELDNDMPPWWLYLFYITIAWAGLYFIYFHVFGIGDSQHVSYMKQMDSSYTEAGSGPGASGFGYQSPLYSNDIDMTPRLRKQLGQFIGKEISFSDLIIEAKRKASPDDLNKLNDIFPTSYVSTSDFDDNSQTGNDMDWTALTDETSLTIGKNVWDKNCAVCHLPDGGGSIGPNMTDEYWIHGGSINDIIKIIMVGVPAKGMIPWNTTLSPDAIHQVSSYILTLQGTKPAKAKDRQGELYQP